MSPNPLKNNRINKPANLVQTIERVDLLLNALSHVPQGISLGELADRVNLPKGTTHRLVSSLAYFDYIRQDPALRTYRLGFKLVTLGNLLLSQIDLRNEARPHLLELAQKTGEAVHLVIFDKDEALYIDKIQLSIEGLHMSSRMGYRAPLHCTAVGKVLLAHMPQSEIARIIEQKGLDKRTPNTISDSGRLVSHLAEIKDAGCALDDEENNEGIRCLAAPIYDMHGRVAAALSVSAPANRIPLDDPEQPFKKRIVETALKISNQLGYHPQIVGKNAGDIDDPVDR